MLVYQSKESKWFRTSVILMCLLMALTSCGKSNSGGSTQETTLAASVPKAEEKTLGEINSYATEQIIGSLDVDHVQVIIPEGALSEGSSIKVEIGSAPTSVDASKMSLNSIPLHLTFEGEQRRTDYPILIKLAVDAEFLKAHDELDGIKAVHYSDATGWTYETPVEINVQEGYVAFEVYNNPLFGSAELTEAERKEQYIKDRALMSWGEKQLESDVQQMTKEIVEQLLVEQFNAKNKSEIEVIAKGVLAELKYGNLEYGKLTTNLMKKDFKSYTANVATLIGKTMSEALEEDLITETLGNLGDASEVVGFLSEGDYKGAGMKIAETISEKSPVYKAAKVWIEVVDTKINNWKNNGIEEAYKAFKEGSNDYILFGYDNDPGDFEAVWNQMRGLGRQIEMDAVKKYAASIGVNEGDLTEAQIKLAKSRAKASIKEQFEKRIVQEAEIEKEEENQREVLAQFEKWGLLERGRSWYPYDQSMERMLDRLYEQIRRIQEETGRFGIVYKNGDLHDQARGLDYIGILKDDEMKLSDLAELIKERYVFGEEAYQKMLEEKGYVKQYALTPGTYKGTLVITVAPIIESAKKAAANPESVPVITDAEGNECEEIDINDEEIQAQLNEAIAKGESVVGKPVPMTVVVTEGSGGVLSATFRIDFAAAFPDYGCEEAVDEPFTISVDGINYTFNKSELQEGFTMNTVFKGKMTGETTMKGTFDVSTTEEQYSGYSQTGSLYSGTFSFER